MTDHYFSIEPKSRLIETKIATVIRKNNFTFITGTGIFSIGEIDSGTKLLIEKCEIKENTKVLDLGCGYGVIGIVISKLFNCEVTLIDINQRAIELSTKNSKLNDVNVKIVQSDLFSNIDSEKFDNIISNPPFHAGKELCFKLIEDSFKHLNENGTLQIVARHKKGGETYSKKMQEVFGNVKDIAKKGGFRIYISYKN